MREFIRGNIARRNRINGFRNDENVGTGSFGFRVNGIEGQKEKRKNKTMILNIERMVAQIIRQHQDETKTEVKAILVSRFIRDELDKTETGTYFENSIEIFTTDDLPDLGIEIINQNK